MSRYGPQVLPVGVSILGSMLGGAAQGYELGENIQSRRDERKRQRALFEMEMAARGAVPTSEWEQTNRPAQARSALAEELTPRVAIAQDPASLAAGALTGVAEGVRRIGEQVSPLRARQAAGQRALAAELTTPEMVTAMATGDLAGMGRTMAEAAPRGMARAAEAAAPPTGQRIADYLSYSDRPRGMQPYQAGEYTVDPMVAYDRTRAASRMEDEELRSELSGVQMRSPVAQALMRAGRFREAMDAEREENIAARWAAREAGVAARAATAADLRERGMSLQEELTQLRERGDVADRDVRLLTALGEDLTRLTGQLAGVTPGDRGAAARNRISQRIADVERQMDAVRERVGLPARGR
jgi:hypothetical protein